jgi:hypothetical protein
LRCSCFDRSNSSQLQFIERGHRGLVNMSLTYPHRKKTDVRTLLSLEQSPF